MFEGKNSTVIDEEIQGTATIKNSPIASSKKVYLESYGCAMNFSDSEIVASILTQEGYQTIKEPETADLVLINTCSIREKAEQTVRNRLTFYKGIKKRHNKNLIVGILGCMAERLKDQLLEEEKLVDIVAGPDSYRDLPNLISNVESGQKAVNVLLSREETYAEISPVKLGENGVSSFISIMRGCDNMCSFCVVPFTRGRERSRNPETIVREAKELFDNGFREVTLLGQNVDSYRWNITKKGEIKNPDEETVSFAQLMEKVAQVHPDLRVRFSTSHPKDMTDDVLHTIAKYENICNYIHLPVQSGNSDVLKRMNRGYTREWYLTRIEAIRRIIPHCSISTDIISGFCGETDEEHQDTISLIKDVKFDFSYMYKYSERPKTLAERKFDDNVSEDVKSKRLTEIVNLQKEQEKELNRRFIGKTKKVLVEGPSKKNPDEWKGRISENTMVIFKNENFKPGEYIQVKISDISTAILKGEVV
ncbi:MAG: tRNA (N6-isopentenyl adenosine(37)-C2)-methylthiotransferase MiaB [Crocinitomicaceae bacterium]|nr:tRNA (N6-isopentenyl adenosine(37)-C2)-methylthiotransferase MiaB [Crocinitomicaceae bacterium]|tara:strand:- start:6537 stop:7967 length:1431 start_codon:yes stop_codon:yes gene_type:complete